MMSKVSLKRAGLAGLMVGLVFFNMAQAGAQTLATGDSRTVVEPTFPAVCTVLTAQQAIVSGGPAFETTFDTARIQAALTACTAGQAVELAGSGANFAFLTAPLNLPTGVSLIVDGGVTLFASRNPADYQISGAETCGSYGSTGAGCNNLFKFGNGSTNANCGLYGYGVIDGRGGSTMLTSTGADTGISWWTNADQANTAGKSQDNFVFMKPSKSTNLTLYKITLRNSPMFHVVTSGVSGLTVWGVKIQAPFTAHNTDGVDPQGTNVTITNSSISDGDDNVAVSASSASSNITISNVTTYSGHGISVGSYTTGGLNNMLVKNVNMAGTAADGNSIALRLKSAADRGNVVQNVTYQNVCIRDTRYPIVDTGYYNTNSGTLIPTLTNIVYQNVHVLPPTSTKYPYKLQLQGYDANHISTLTFNNVSIETLLAANVAGTTTTTPAYTSIALANNVYPAFLTTLTGTGVTETGAATTNLAANTGDCTATSTIFPYIVGELYASTASATNLQSATLAAGASLTLNAMVQPAMSQTTFNGTVGNYTGAAALTAGVGFYLGTTKVGSGTFSTTSNGTIASLTLPTPASGTYTAQYQGDANYGAITFGSVAVTVSSGLATTTSFTAVPATITYGAYPTLTSTVTASSGTPAGTITYSEGAKTYPGGTLSGGKVATSALLFGAGAHTLTANYSGNTTYSASASTPVTLLVNQASSTTAVTAAPATITANGTTTLTVTLTGVSNTAATVPGGTVSFSDGGTSLGNATLSGGTALLPVTLATSGSHTITASYLGDANYAASSGTVAVTVNSAASTTVLTVPANQSFGSMPTLTATVTSASGSPTGIVTFYDGTTSLGQGTLTSGTATYSVYYLAAGSHSFSAVYGGDTSFATSTSPTVAATVAQATTTATLTLATNPVYVGNQEAFTASISGVSGFYAPTGYVVFSDGTTTLGRAQFNVGTGFNLSIATASFSLPNIGNRTITVTYAGDSNYSGSTGTASVTVLPITTTTTIAGAAVSYPGGSVVYTITVTPLSGYSAPGAGTVTILSNGTAVGTATVGAGGVATYTLTAGVAGTYAITASYAALGNYGASTSSASTLTVGAPFTFAVTPSTLNVAAGSSGAVSLGLTPGNGFTGAVALTCSSPVSYVSCSVASASATLAGTATTTVAGTVTVAATKSSIGRPFDGTLYAWLMPAGLLALAGTMRRRKALRGALLMAMLACVAAAGLTGCGSASGTGTTSNKPTGSYVVTFTATAAGTTQSGAVTVNIQ